MKKKCLCIIAVCCALTAVTSIHSEERFHDVKQVMTQLITTQKTYITAIKKAKKDEDVINAVTAFGNALVILHPKFQGITSKHPELREMKNIPDDITALVLKAQKLNRSIKNVTLTMMYRFSYRENVKKAVHAMREKLAPYEN